MPYADPLACPSCHGVIAGQAACPHCGLVLTTTEVQQLWQVLVQADEWLARADRHRVRTAAPVGVPPSAPVPPAPVGAPLPTAPPPYPAPVRPRPARRWSVGTVLLVLGPLSLVVAGLIFITRSWEDVGLAVRTLILLGVTVAVGALAAWVTRRPLRASAEAVWTIVLSLLTLDFFAARHEGLAGLGGLDVPWAWLVWGVVALALSVAIAVWSRPSVHVALVAPAVVGGVALVLAGVGAAAIADDVDLAWRAVAAVVVVGILALATRPAGLPPMTRVARVVVGGFFAMAYVAAAGGVVGHPALDDLLAGGHGVPLVLMAVAALVVAVLVRPARVGGAALAVVAVSLLAVAPVTEAWGKDGTLVAVAVLAALLALAGTSRTDDWARGARFGATPALAGLVVAAVALLADVVVVLGDLLDSPWTLAPGATLSAGSTFVGPSRWAAVVVLAGLVVTAWAAARWPEISAERRHAVDAAVVAAAIGGYATVVAVHPDVWVAVTVVLVAGAVLGAAHVRRLGRASGPLAGALVTGAALLAVATQGVSVAAWAAGAFLLAVLALVPGPAGLRRGYAALGVVLAAGSAAALTDLLGGSDSVVAAVVLAAALATLAATGLRLVGPVLREAVEQTAAAVGLVALLSPAAAAELSIRWTAVGVVLMALSFVVRERRWYVWPGAVALLVAYVLLLVDSGFSFVEAYTLPLGVAALAVGLVLVRRRPESGTWPLLGPGLAVAVLPSLPQALAEPTDLRALLVGAGALVALTVGVRLAWQAPFVAGAVVLALVVLFNIGPYANAAPRVVLLAVVGVVLTGVGITWEDRVRDGRRLVGYVRAMR